MKIDWDKSVWLSSLRAVHSVYMVYIVIYERDDVEPAYNE